MPIAAVSVRVVVESGSRRLVARLATALEDAEMAPTRELLIHRLSGGDAIETVVRHGCMRVALRPFAELMLREIMDIAEFKGLPTSTRDRLAREAMIAAGYA